ncbi:MAG: alkaline serine protease [Armatimonadetes bacterium]|nr:alkaline serine protease [Armatimonadota bacterium]
MNRSWKPRFALTLIASAVLACSTAVPARAGTLSEDLASLLKQPLLSRTRVIIQTNGRPTSLLTTTLSLLGAQGISIFESVDGLVASVPVSILPTLLNRLDVVHISPDLPVNGAMDVTNEAVGARAAREETGLTGAGVGVAVLDTGVAPHTDLTSPTNRLVGWTDLVNGKKTAYDDNGHGTHIAGIIAGDGTAAARVGKDLRGIAPRANIIGVKVLDQNMAGYTSTVIKGLDYCLANRLRYNIRVVNLSLGQLVRQSYQKDPLCRAVETSWKAGMVVVVSAGNLGRVDIRNPESGVRFGSITAPGNDPLVITVGATRANGTGAPTDDEMATFSSRGPTQVDHVMKPDLVAAGNRILSLGTGGALAAAFPARMTSLGGASYMELSGTSMAAPVVTGAVALMLQGSPLITPDTVKIRLMHTAVKRWNPAVGYDPFARGAGLLSVGAALRNPELALQRAASPSADRGAEPGQFLVSGSRALWGSLPTWGGQNYWSDEAVWGEAAYSPYGSTSSYGSTSTSSYSYYGGAAAPSGGSTYNPYGSYTTPTSPSGGSADPYNSPSGSPYGSPSSNDNDQTMILWGEPALYDDGGAWSNSPQENNDQAMILWGEPSLYDDP